MCASDHLSVKETFLEAPPSARSLSPTPTAPITRGISAPNSARGAAPVRVATVASPAGALTPQASGTILCRPPTPKSFFCFVVALCRDTLVVLFLWCVCVWGVVSDVWLVICWCVVSLVWQVAGAVGVQCVPSEWCLRALSSFTRVLLAVRCSVLPCVVASLWSCHVLSLRVFVFVSCLRFVSCRVLSLFACQVSVCSVCDVVGVVLFVFWVVCWKVRVRLRMA